MSYTFYIEIDFAHRPVRYVDLVRQFVQAGWSPFQTSRLPNVDRWIEYYIADANGWAEAHYARPECFEQVLEELAQHEGEVNPPIIDLRWPETSTVIRLNFGLPDRDRLLISVPSDRIWLNGLGSVTDHNWYLCHILPPLRDAGCRWAKVQFRECA